MIKKYTALALCLLCTATVTASALAADKKPIPTPKDPQMMAFDGVRGMNFCEFWLFKGTPETGISAAYFNTTDLNNNQNKMVTCPSDLWDKASVPSLMSSYDVTAARKNGPRGLTMDAIAVPVGPVETFEGIQTRWFGEAKVPKGVTLKGVHLNPYQTLKSYRNSSISFNKGKPVFIIEDDEGTSWVMISYGQTVDPSLSYETLKDLGAKIKLAPGWKNFRMTMLEQDLTISTPKGYNWIVQDEFENTYNSCKDACNFEP